MRETFKNGIIKNNPTFALVLGMCPTLATTTSVLNAMGMGLSTMAVLVCSNLVISLLRNIIPQKIRIAGYIVIIAGFVTIVEMLLAAFLPDLYNTLGLFIPLIVVNCIILGRAEEFASKNGVLKSVADGFGIGIGFTLSLSLIACVREILGAGQLFGIDLFPQGFQGATIMILAPGGFLTLGILLGIINFIGNKRKEKGAVK